ncbi:MAG: phage portal protein [Solobacterium sp.]|nr:phage portal protein [Solobacterium sp.]
MGLMEGLKNMIQSWLEITPAQKDTVIVEEAMDHQTNVAKNRLWQRGDPYELQQLYKNNNIHKDDAMFWGSVPSKPIRKIHTGLPGLIVDRLTDIVVRDMNEVELDSDGEGKMNRKEEWEAIADESENNFSDMIKTAISETLVTGDGAFKISFDTSLTDQPIIEFYPADRVEFDYKRKRLREVIFKTVLKDKDKRKYTLLEHYGWGYIKYQLLDQRGELTDLGVLPETSGLVNVGFGGYTEGSDGRMKTRGNYMMAVPLKFFDSPKYPGRGMSILDRKIYDFDAFDEIVSQWADAVRRGRAQTYIPDSMVPKDGNGRNIIPSAFENNWIAVGRDMSENAQNKIQTEQPDIPAENYLQTYITFLDLCLQGLISPSTLGIDTKKIDNAEAQREKEKATLYTRNAIVDALTPAIRKLVRYSLMAVDSHNQKENPAVLDMAVDINFGEYANPSFEAVVETVGKAKTQGIMSTETCVDEMYGDSKDDDWKREEVARIKAEQGIQSMEEPDLQSDLILN